MRRIFFIGILFFLAACAGQPAVAASAQHPVAVTLSNDGELQGSGQAQDGVQFTVKFTVRERSTCGNCLQFYGKTELAALAAIIAF